MNKNFKTNLIALLAIVSGTSCGSCFAFQDSSSVNHTNSAVVQNTDNTPIGAFGAVVLAVAPSENQPKKVAPPIVSQSPAVTPNIATGAELPPIVSQSSARTPNVTASTDLPPIVSQSPAAPLDSATSTELPPIVSQSPAAPLQIATGAELPPIVSQQQAEPSQIAAVNALQPIASQPPAVTLDVDAGTELPPIVSQQQAESSQIAAVNALQPISTPELSKQIQTSTASIEEPSKLPPIKEANEFESSVVPVPFPQESRTELAQEIMPKPVQPIALLHPINPPAPETDSPVINASSTPQSQVQLATMLTPISTDDIVEPTTGSDILLATVPPQIIQADALRNMPNSTANQQATRWAPKNRQMTNNVSSGGVPIYREQLRANPPMTTGLSNTPPVIQTSSTVLNIAPPVVGNVPQTASFPRSVRANAVAAKSPISVGTAPPVETALNPNYFSAPAAEAPVITTSQNGNSCSGCNGRGCSDCGIATTVGGAASNCESCGTGGCFNPGSVKSRFGASGSVSDARRYLHAEVLYFDREDGTISNSNFGSLNDFDWNLGWRLTFGAKSDSLSGREFSYMGIMPVEQTVTRTDAAARINARFSVGDGFTGAEISSFKNAVSQTEYKETQIHSFEYNRTTWGWDVVKSFVGLRYFYIDDQYMMTSLNNIGETGTFEMSTVNNLFGPHAGGELFYDVGYRLSYSLAGKAGVYANLNKVDTSLFNAGAQFMDVSDNSATVSTSLELNMLAHYQLSRSARLRLGYNFLWVGEVASVSDNFIPVLSPTAGTNSSDDDDMLFHGASFGLEIFR